MVLSHPVRVLVVGALVGAAVMGRAPSVEAQDPPPGIVLSDEVVALELTSPELDRATERVESTRGRLAEDRAELAGAAAAAETTVRARTAVTSLVERREAQVAKATTAHRRERSNLSLLATEWFVTGFGALENLDPAISEARREELVRQRVFAETLAERSTRAVGHTGAVLEALRTDLDSLRSDAEGLADRIERLEVRRGELERSIELAQQQLPELDAAVRSAQLGARVEGTELSALALEAYWRAQLRAALVDPDCGVSWASLAGIGRTESRHGTFRGATLGIDGIAAPPIYGPLLDGSNDFAVVGDTDGGGLDGSSAADRAVGPMQFLPGTWRAVAVDATGDGLADPQNIFDAAATAAAYLCRSGPGLQTEGPRRRALLSYNRSEAYVAAVFRAEDEYRSTVALG